MAWTSVGNVLTFPLSGLSLSSPYTVSVRAFDAAGARGPAASNSFTTSAGGGGGGSGPDNFPRLSSFMAGSPQTYDSTFQTYAAKIHIVVLGGGYEAWQNNHGLSKQTVTSSIKAQSVVSTRVFQFWTLDTSTVSSGGAGNPTYVNKVNSMNWWLRDSGGNIVISLFASTDGEVNMTNGGPLDPATGLGPYAWGAKLANDMYHLGLYPATGTSAWPSLDGFLVDDLFWKPRQDGNWLRNGFTTDSQNDSTVQLAFRTGQQKFFSELAAIFPSASAQGGNIADWYPGNGANSTQPMAPSLGLFEHAIGASYSVDTWGGVGAVQASVQFQLANMVGPKYIIFSHDDVTATGSDNYGPNWQAMRYGITAALMNNAYYFANTSGGNYFSNPADCLWFDEYNGGSLAHVGYLGQPLSTSAGAAQTAAWSNGVWKREFANGIALWNPKGNGSKTVSLSGTFYHLRGSEPGNTGASTTSVSLNDRDGVILLRNSPP
jgi:hypothetical protein